MRVFVAGGTGVVGRRLVPQLVEVAGGKPPLKVPSWLVQPFAGSVVVGLMTEGRGFSNAKTKRELGWQLRFPSLPQGFKDAVAED